MVNKDTIYSLQSNLVDTVTYLSYVLYILIAFGLYSLAPDYLYILQLAFKIYISIFLIYRFNPFTKSKFTPLDAKIAFNAGAFLLATTIINSALSYYLFGIIKQEI